MPRAETSVGGDEALHHAREEARRLGEIVNLSPAVVFRWKAAPGWPVAYVSTNVLQFGYAKEDLERGVPSFADMVHPEDLSRVGEEVERHTREGRRSFEQEYRIFTKDGDTRWLDDRTWVCRDAAGHVTHYQGIVLDVTRRKDVEDRLRETKGLLEAIIQGAPLAIGVVDLDRTVRLWNPVAERIFGWTAAEVMGRTLPTVPPEREENARRIFDALASGRSVVADARALRKDGALIDVEVSAAPLRGSDGAVRSLVALIADVSERRKLGQAVLRAQKLESLGILAGGIAHSFNNRLAAILGYASMAAQRLSPQDPAATHLRKLLDVAEGAANLARKMIAYSGRGKTRLEPVDLVRLVRDGGALAVAAASAGVRLSHDLGQEMPPVLADAEQIEQALVNLLVNASEAADREPADVRIVVRSRDVGPGDEALWRYTGRPLEPGRYASVAVEDDGCGMDPSTLDRIFEPFFSTKRAGRGLGLPAVLGIVRGHGGGIAASSEAGRGSRFEIVLPVIEKSPEARSAR